MTPRVTVDGRALAPTPVFEAYWHLAAERQRIFFRRLRGERPPWTTDAVLRDHRFTNAYRASDRVSQHLINSVIYGHQMDVESTVLRVLLFKIFNRIETWEFLESAVGPITLGSFDARAMGDLLDERMAAGDRLYSAAYIMPSPLLGEARKHRNHLLLLKSLLDDGTLLELTRARSLADLYRMLAGVRSFGPFLAFQFAIDLNYSALFGFSEMDFVVAGPGARDGIAKCFERGSELQAEDVIRAVTETADDWFSEFGIDFESLWGRPLQLIDCQNLFCEVSKYSRVTHPHVAGVSGRTRIKQRYSPTELPVAVGYPPMWGLPMAARSIPEPAVAPGAAPAKFDLSQASDAPSRQINLHDSTSGDFNLSPDVVALQDGLLPLVS
jgi:hypothetical protein